MKFWLLMFVIDLLIPLTMVIFGKSFVVNPPKKINYLYGYRTARSMKSQATWNFAHQYFGKLWLKLGWLTGLISMIVMFLVFKKSEKIISLTGGLLCALQMIPLIGPIIPTEKALRKNFDEDGDYL